MTSVKDRVYSLLLVYSLLIDVNILNAITLARLHPELYISDESASILHNRAFNISAHLFAIKNKVCQHLTACLDAPTK